MTRSTSGCARMKASTRAPGAAQAKTVTDKDKAKPSASNCNEACAEMWPPALGDPASVQLQGVDPALVGEVTRDDGTKQLTLSGWPLYTFAKDTKPGDTTGDGFLNGAWHIAKP